MASDRKIPDNPLEFITARIRSRRIFWTYHVNLRLEQRVISRETILSAVDSYEIVEMYPMDKYLPSYLVLARHRDDAFHILFATDVQYDNLRIITAYRPTLDEWHTDLRTRRKSQ